MFILYKQVWLLSLLSLGGSAQLRAPQAFDHSDIPLENWAAPPFWQRSPVEASDAEKSPPLHSRRKYLISFRPIDSDEMLRPWDRDFQGSSEGIEAERRGFWVNYRNVSVSHLESTAAW